MTEAQKLREKAKLVAEESRRAQGYCRCIDCQNCLGIICISRGNRRTRCLYENIKIQDIKIQKSKYYRQSFYDQPYLRSGMGRWIKCDRYKEKEGH